MKADLSKAHAFYGIAKEGALHTDYYNSVPLLFATRAQADLNVLLLEGEKVVKVYLVVEDE